MRRLLSALAVAVCAVALTSTPAMADQFHDHGDNPNPVLFENSLARFVVGFSSLWDNDPEALV